MKITIAQLNYIIGDFEGNTKKIIEAAEIAAAEGSDLVVFSELAICGYPPLDLLEHKSFVEKCQQSITQILPVSNKVAIVLGTPTFNTGTKGKNLFNSALFLADGMVHQSYHKALLPTYDIFDEYRYFQPAENFQCFDFKGKRIALTICEDLWYKQPLLTNFGKNKLYTINPLDKYTEQHPDLVINIAASPFAHNHDAIKSEILTHNAQKYKVPIVYVNQVGAHTELIFDGGSRVINASGATSLKLDTFNESVQTFDLEETLANSSQPSTENYIANIHNAIVLGIRDYFAKMNFKTAVLGLSGGIDSAVTLALAAEALGAEQVRVLLLPSKYSSDHSVNDAIAMAKNLNVKYDIIRLHHIVEGFDNALEPLFAGQEPGLAEENIQARIRGTLLMAISNKFGNILLNTSNKSEAAVGYSTLYGDMNGGLSVLGDVYKTDVYRLALHINRNGEIIPENTLTKPPSAELRPDQKDSDSLPDYELLDQILYHYIELRASAEEIPTITGRPELVKKVIQMVNRTEYKRFQTPPILRVSSKAFGLGRRMPLVARY